MFNVPGDGACCLYSILRVACKADPHVATCLRDMIAKWVVTMWNLNPGNCIHPFFAIHSFLMFHVQICSGYLASRIATPHHQWPAMTNTAKIRRRDCSRYVPPSYQRPTRLLCIALNCCLAVPVSPPPLPLPVPPLSSYRLCCRRRRCRRRRRRCRWRVTLQAGPGEIDSSKPERFQTMEAAAAAEHSKKRTAHYDEFQKLQEYKRKLAAGELTEDDY